MILRKLKKWLRNLPIFSVRHSVLTHINTIMTKNDYEIIFKHYLGGFVEYKIEEHGGSFADIYVNKTCKLLNRRYNKMKKFIEPRCMICITMHYA